MYVHKINIFLYIIYHITVVFPLHLENLWIQFDYGRWITSVTGASKINSVQNGLLMSSNFHSRFDQYLIGINPDVSILEPELDQLF
jgi:hypothetical protein